MRRRTVRTGHVLGTAGGAAALWWAIDGAQGGDLSVPFLTFTAAIVVGAAIGGVTGLYAGGSPARTTLPLGIGALAGAIGAIAGTAFGVHGLGQDLIDGNGNILLASAFVGAGLGWIGGAAAGAVAARGAPALTPAQIRAARIAAVGLVVVGVVIAVSLARVAGPGAGHGRFSALMQTVAITDAVLVALTVAVAAGARPRRGPAGPSRSTRLLARFGLTLGCVVLVTLAARIPGSELDRRVTRLAVANARTASSLAEAGAAFAERSGQLPASVETLLHAGGTVAPGSYVNGVWRLPHGFCIEVGTDVDALVGAPPLQSEFVRLGATRSGGLREKVSGGGIGGCAELVADGT